MTDSNTGEVQQVVDALLRLEPCPAAEAWLKTLIYNSAIVPGAVLWSIHRECPRPTWLMWIAQRTPIYAPVQQELFRRVLVALSNRARELIPEMPPARWMDIQTIIVSYTQQPGTKVSERQLVDARYELHEYAFDRIRVTRDARKYVVLDAIYNTIDDKPSMRWDSRLVAKDVLAQVYAVLPFAQLTQHTDLIFTHTPNQDTGNGQEPEAHHEDGGEDG